MGLGGAAGRLCPWVGERVCEAAVLGAEASAAKAELGYEGVRRNERHPTQSLRLGVRLPRM